MPAKSAHANLNKRQEVKLKMIDDPKNNGDDKDEKEEGKEDDEDGDKKPDEDSE